MNARDALYDVVYEKQKHKNQITLQSAIILYKKKKERKKQNT